MPPARPSRGGARPPLARGARHLTEPHLDARARVTEAATAGRRRSRPVSMRCPGLLVSPWQRQQRSSASRRWVPNGRGFQRVGPAALEAARPQRVARRARESLCPQRSRSGGAVGGGDDPSLLFSDRSTHGADPEVLAVDPDEGRLVAFAGEAAPELDREVRCRARPDRGHVIVTTGRRPRQRGHNGGIGIVVGHDPDDSRGR